VNIPALKTDLRTVAGFLNAKALGAGARNGIGIQDAAL
jgi:hypothetical protein